MGRHPAKRQARHSPSCLQGWVRPPSVAYSLVAVSEPGWGAAGTAQFVILDEAACRVEEW